MRLALTRPLALADEVLSARGRALLHAGFALFAIGLLASLAIALSGPSPSGFDGAFVEFAYPTLFLIPAGICIARAVTIRRERAAWLVIATAFVAWFTGWLLYNEVVRTQDPLPYPSIADGFWLAFYPLVLAGLALLLRARMPRVRASLWLDALIGMLAAGAVTATILFDPIVASTGGSATAVAANLAYPLGDLLLLGFLLGVFALSGWRPGRGWPLIAAGLALQFVTDTVYLYQAAAGTFQQGTLVDTGWMVTGLLVAVAAWQQPEQPRPGAPERWAQLIAPSAFTVVALALLVYQQFLAEETNHVGAAFATTALAAGLARTALNFGDLRALASRERIKDEFTSVVSHELRTPLTSIRGSLGLLASGVLGPVPPKAQRMLDIAVSNTDRLVRLINDILDIERMESGGITMERQHCSVPQLVRDAVEAMRPLAEENGVRLRIEIDDATVCADPDRIVQTLTNLLSNAIKFSPAGGTVELAAEAHDGEVLFRVSDEGRGIPEQMLEEVFERFQQVDASDSREKGGTGLGLSICRSIVSQHGGRIWAESPPGEGASFFVALPAPARAPARPPAPDRPLVLVCDDDSSVREVLEATLERRGFATLSAASAEETLALARRHSPAAILLDLLLPGMNGWDAAVALKADPRTASIPLVILSVLAPADTRQPDAEVFEWLTKPFDHSALFRALERAAAGEAPLRRILIVEDDDDLARVLAATLERHGIETAQARSESEAIALSQRLLPDLIVLDLALLDGNGFAVADWLRQHERLHAVPLVVYTGRDLDAADRDRLRLGETEFLVKGRITPQDFERLVTRLLERITQANPEEASHAEAHPVGR